MNIGDSVLRGLFSIWIANRKAKFNNKQEEPSSSPSTTETQEPNTSKPTTATSPKVEEKSVKKGKEKEKDKDKEKIGKSMDQEKKGNVRF